MAFSVDIAPVRNRSTPLPTRRAPSSSNEASCINKSDNRTTDPQPLSRVAVVDALIHIAAVILDLVWHPSQVQEKHGSGHHRTIQSTKHFIQEILRRSRSSFYVLQLSLFYLIRLRNRALMNAAHAPALTDNNPDLIHLPADNRDNSSLLPTPTLPSPPHSEPEDQEAVCIKAELLEVSTGPTTPPAWRQHLNLPQHDAANTQSNAFASSRRTLPPPLPLALQQPPPVTRDSHRAFLACLILASKYLDDRTHSARAWSQFSGLPLWQINELEREALLGLGHALHVGPVVGGDGGGFSGFCTMTMQKAVQLAKIRARLAAARNAGQPQPLKRQERVSILSTSQPLQPQQRECRLTAAEAAAAFAIVELGRKRRISASELNDNPVLARQGRKRVCTGAE
ncbi:hypothetical protein DFJ73DRAFT_797220 [Zopfochytrium polystomum]|nr:hypothetical protein DFJ73DRAFT_797220 [Zopfochytrium polystomum]